MAVKKKKKAVSRAQKTNKLSKEHHELSKGTLLLPGAFLLFAIFLLINGQESWSFLFVGIAIVIAILIHKEEE